MIIKHGSLLNQHRWKYTSDNTRICQKCGECQRYKFYVTGGSYWENVSLNQVQEQMVKDELDAKKREQTNLGIAESKRIQAEFDKEDAVRTLEYLSKMERRNDRKMNENESIIKKCSEQYYVNFSEMGSYDSLEYWVDSLEEAEKKLKNLQTEYPGHFGFIAKPIKVVRTE